MRKEAVRLVQSMCARLRVHRSSQLALLKPHGVSTCYHELARDGANGRKRSQPQGREEGREASAKAEKRVSRRDGESRGVCHGKIAERAGRQRRRIDKLGVTGSSPVPPTTVVLITSTWLLKGIFQCPVALRKEPHRKLSGCSLICSFSTRVMTKAPGAMIIQLATQKKIARMAISRGSARRPHDARLRHVTTLQRSL